MLSSTLKSSSSQAGRVKLGAGPCFSHHFEIFIIDLKKKKRIAWRSPWKCQFKNKSRNQVSSLEVEGREKEENKTKTKKQEENDAKILLKTKMEVTKRVIGAWKTSQKTSQKSTIKRPVAVVTLAWHASKHKVYKHHQGRFSSSFFKKFSQYKGFFFLNSVLLSSMPQHTRTDLMFQGIHVRTLCFKAYPYVPYVSRHTRTYLMF